MFAECEFYDVVVIGGGIVGCALLYTLSQQGYRCALVEKNENLAMEASGGNSGMLHVGFDCKPENILETKALHETYEPLMQMIKQWKIPYRTVGALMIATSIDDLSKLRKFATSSDGHVKVLSSSEVSQLEPNLSTDLSIVGGLLVPGETVVDSGLLAISLAHHAVRHGAEVFTGRQVVQAIQQAAGWKLRTSSGNFLCSKWCINAGGLWADTVDMLALGHCNYNIHPRRGDFLIYEKAASTLLNHIIFPMPTPNSKGILVFPSAYGHLVVGPTAEDTEDRQLLRPISVETRANLTEYARRLLPELKKYKLIGMYSGLRPATEYDDYQIIPRSANHWITVAGIRSTGVSGCLGIAKAVLKLLADQLQPSRPVVLSRGSASAAITHKPSYVFDGIEYPVTHRLMNLMKVAKL